MGVLNTINTIGFICALPFTGYLSDKLGHRRPIHVGSVITIIGAVIQTALQNIGMFFAARYLLRFGLSVASVAAPAFVSGRIPSALQALPSIIQISLSCWIPESPRWLIYKDRRDEAIQILAKHHAGGDMQSPLVLYEIAEISAALGAEKLQSSSSYMEFFHTSKFTCVLRAWSIC